jgi:EEF1A lysine methyltransferase 4
MSDFVEEASDSDEEEFERRRQELMASNSKLAKALGLKPDVLAAIAEGRRDGITETFQDKANGSTHDDDPNKGDELTSIDKDVQNTRRNAELGSCNADYGLQEYWDKRFKEEEEYDWLCSFSELKNDLLPVLEEAMVALGVTSRTDLTLLIIGAGNSTFSAELFKEGFETITNIDYSSNVIDKMLVKHPEMKWIEMNMLDMAFASGSFDVVIDKATMDALMVSESDPWCPSQENIESSDKYLSEVSRVLVRNNAMTPKGKQQLLTTTSCGVGGMFIMISFQQPHFRSKYLMRAHLPSSLSSSTSTPPAESTLESSAVALGACADYGWALDEPISIRGGEGSLGFFQYVMRAI